MREAVLDTAHNRLQSNPLASPQRETAGPRTFEKYEYQYHWALCRILGAHELSNDYVVFIELHEDVVLATSSDVALAEFEFNQVKNVSTPPWNWRKLTLRPKGRTKKEKNSVLGKMLLGVCDKPFIDKLNSINLVATCGFNLPPKTEGLKLSIISIGEIHDECINDIQSAIDKELGSHPLPKMLTFITPDLPSTGFQDAAIGRISKLVELSVPGAKCSAQSIYRVLIDDLHRKGSVAFDYTQWSNLVKNKGMTYQDVERVISAYTENKGIESFSSDFDNITEEMGLKFNKKVGLRRALERYHNAVRLERSLIAMDKQQAVKAAVENNFSVFDEHGAVSLIEAALGALPENVKKNLIDLESAQAAIIYELISKCHEK
ncbi:hypothetical protein Mettu_1971 [Methylobacter tundripaludum SV96]|uniref:CD-NTase associated protein 4-like DNA endonuclease domain-containing protein n=1 Tax=Methylobacter tundripaludum (strain ATCC BAA-1195 / DSM 17260 / SV96) TaxID=697282 RepID=G3IWS2_METTV|nr:hypothetical protein Mettu_1971 [Methylobacter tundripaludum SV96]